MKNNRLLLKIKCYLKPVFSIVFIIFIVLGLSSCKEYKNENSALVDKVYITAIESYPDGKKSYYHFYDENLNYLYSERCSYGELGADGDMYYIDGKIYAVESGPFGVVDDPIYIEYDLKKDEYKKIPIGTGNPLSTLATQDYLFATNRQNSTATITRVNNNLDENNLLKVDYEDKLFSAFNLIDGELCADMMDTYIGERHYLVKLSIEDLSIKEQYDITKYGSARGFLKYGDNLYTTISYIPDENGGTQSNKLLVQNLTTKEFTEIELPSYSAKDILCYKDKIIISHFHHGEKSANFVTVYDPLDGSLTSNEVDVSSRLMKTDGEYIYIFGTDFDDRADYLTKYSLNGNKLEEIQRINIEEKGKTGSVYTFCVCK